MNQSAGKGEFSYGWVVVFAGMLITLIIYGIVASLAVFFKPLLQSFQWGRGASLAWGSCSAARRHHCGNSSSSSACWVPWVERPCGRRWWSP